MPDRVEREIEEILAKLEDGPPGDRQPISISAARKKTPPRPKAPRPPGRPLLQRLNLPAMMFGGAGLMVAGLFFSSANNGLIWVSFAGVIMFLAAFVLSFVRSGGRRSASQPQGHYWRDRYITYTPQSGSAWQRLKRRFRR